VREIALATGITERAAHAVLKDLREASIVIAQRDGRQNVYRINPIALAQHPRWAAFQMEIPRQLVEATLRGLDRVAAEDAFGPGAAALPPDSTRRWGFLTTHALIVIHVTQHPRSTVRQIAVAVGVTERAAYATLQDLREAGIIDRQRDGRRNHHSVNFDQLAAYRRGGTSPDLVPDPFVASLIDTLLTLRAPDYAS